MSRLTVPARRSSVDNTSHDINSSKCNVSHSCAVGARVEEVAPTVMTFPDLKHTACGVQLASFMAIQDTRMSEVLVHLKRLELKSLSSESLCPNDKATQWSHSDQELARDLTISPLSKLQEQNKMLFDKLSKEISSLTKALSNNIISPNSSSNSNVLSLSNNTKPKNNRQGWKKSRNFQEKNDSEMK